MAKLIGHLFNGKTGEYTTFEVNGLKETEKQYKKTEETAPGVAYEHWNIMPKAELSELRRGWSNRFTMYALTEEMARFKGLVIAALERDTENARQKYEAAAALLKMASGTSHGTLRHFTNDALKMDYPSGTSPEPEETEGKP